MRSDATRVLLEGLNVFSGDTDDDDIDDNGEVVMITADDDGKKYCMKRRDEMRGMARRKTKPKSLLSHTNLRKKDETV